MRRVLVATIAAFAFVTLSSPPALGQEALGDEQIEALGKLAELVRWGGMLASVVLIFVSWLLLRFVNNMVTRLGQIFAERRLFFQKLNAIFQFTVYLVVIVTVVLLSFKISKEILALLGGAAAVAIGFAMKDLVASVVAGIMIMADRPFQLGDRVSFGGQYGDITAIGLRSVKLQTLDDNTVTIPNNMFLSEISSSGNYGALDMQVYVDFHIGLDQDARLAQDLVREAAITSRYVHLPKPVRVGVSQIIVQDTVALRLRLRAYVLDTQFEKAFETDVTLRVLDAFAENAILPPAVLQRSIDHLAAAKTPAPELGAVSV